MISLRSALFWNVTQRVVVISVRQFLDKPSARSSKKNVGEELALYAEITLIRLFCVL